METVKISGLRNGNRKNFQFTEWKPEKFPVYGMETGKISSLRNGNRKNFWFTEWKREKFPVYATNFRIISFPQWKFFSGKMETLVPMY